MENCGVSLRGHTLTYTVIQLYRFWIKIGYVWAITLHKNTVCDLLPMYYGHKVYK